MPTPLSRTQTRRKSPSGSLPISSRGGAGPRNLRAFDTRFWKSCLSSAGSAATVGSGPRALELGFGLLALSDVEDGGADPRAATVRHPYREQARDVVAGPPGIGGIGEGELQVVDRLRGRRHPARSLCDRRAQERQRALELPPQRVRRPHPVGSRQGVVDLHAAQLLV